MARIPYLTQDDLSEADRDALDALSDEDSEAEKKDEDDQVGVRNVFRVMAHNVDLLEGFRAYGSTLWHSSGLSPVERELVILATAASVDSAYEWHQHVRISQQEGVSIDQINAVSGGKFDELEPAHAALVEYTTRFVDGTVDDDVHERLAEHYDDDQILAIGTIAGTYLGLARVLDALDVEIEKEETFVGWDVTPEE